MVDHTKEKLLFGVFSVGVVVIVALLLSSSVFADAEHSGDLKTSVYVPSSCTVSGQGTGTHVDIIPNGTYTSDIGTTSMKIICNDPTGFSVYATGNTGGQVGEENSNKLVGAASGITIDTGTATSAGDPDVSNWAMKLAVDSGATYPITLTSGYNDYHEVPNEYTKVATRLAATDVGTGAIGATMTSTYAIYISKTQPSDTYTGQMKYVLVHPNNAPTPEPCPDNQPCMRVAALPSKRVYNEGDEVDIDGIRINLYNPDGSVRREIPPSELTVEPTIIKSTDITYANSNGVKARSIPIVQQVLVSPDGSRQWSGVASEEFWYTDWKDNVGRNGLLYITTYGGEAGEDYYFTAYDGALYALHDGSVVSAIVPVYTMWYSQNVSFWYWYRATSTGTTPTTFSRTMINETSYPIHLDNIPKSAVSPAGVGLNDLDQKIATITVSWYDSETGETYRSSYIVDVN